MSRTTQPTGTDIAERFACRAARRWVRLYTARLSPDVRDRRRGEIESDLWEHVADAHANQRTPFMVQRQVLARMFTGIPADLVWSRRVRHHMKEQRPMKQRRLRAVALSCVAVVLVTFFSTNLLVDKANAETHADIWWILAVPVGFFLVGAIGLVATGLLIRERRNSRPATH